MIIKQPPSFFSAINKRNNYAFYRHKKASFLAAPEPTHRLLVKILFKLLRKTLVLTLYIQL